MDSPVNWLSVWQSAGIVLALGSSAFLWLRSAPQALLSALKELQENQQQLADAFDASNRSVDRFKLDVDGTLESIQRLADTVERTRKQAAARDSKGNPKKKEPEIQRDAFGLPTDPELRTIALERLRPQ